MQGTGATSGELGSPCLPSGAPGDGKSGLPRRARWGARRCQGERAVCRGPLRSLACLPGGFIRVRSLACRSGGFIRVRSLACRSEGFIRGPGSGPRLGRAGACARGRPGMLRASTEPKRRIRNRSRKKEEVRDQEGPLAVSGRKVGELGSRGTVS